MNLTIEDGKFLINTARKAIELFLSSNKILTPKNYAEKFLQKRGVFTTLKVYPTEELRGCIGVPYPEKTLIKAVVDSAINSATSDPRFNQVSLDELNKILVEVTILTEPELIKTSKPKEYLEKIEIGKHGLIIEKGPFKGLLLPQVASEFKFTADEFLSQACMKAGLLSDAWLANGLNVYRFQGQIFSELKPQGKVIEKKY